MAGDRIGARSRLLDFRFTMIIIVLLFVAVLCTAAWLLSRQYGLLRDQAAGSDKRVAGFLSALVLEHERAVIGLLESCARRPLFIESSRRMDSAAAHRHLKDLKKGNAEIDLTFVSDRKGILWANYPVFPEALGKDLSYRDWYKGVSAGWKPYVSGVFKLIVADKPLAVSVAVPIIDDDGKVLGVLANSQRLDFLSEIIRNVPLDSYTRIALLDGEGNVIYSNNSPNTREIVPYPRTPDVRTALESGKNQVEITESGSRGNTVFLTVRAVTQIGWTIAVEHTRKDVLRVGYGQFATTIAMCILVFLILTLFLLYARKQLLLADSEARFKAAAEGSLDAFFVLRNVRDKKGVIADFEFRDLNGPAEKMIGMSRQQVIGRNLCELLPINRTGGFFDKYARAVETGQPLDEEFPLSSDSLQALWIHHQVIPLPDGVAIMSRDITERKRSEEVIRDLNVELSRHVAQLESANKELEAFSYAVSHDLRAPLRGIDGWSLALLEDYGSALDDEAGVYLARVRAEAQQMGFLIDDLLKLSRVTRAEMQWTDVDLTALAFGLSARLREDNPGRRLEFAIQKEMKTKGDARLLEIALSNLLNNAVKFTGPRTEARIEVGETELNGVKTFFVSDNGVGFDMAYAQKLFGAFQRLHKSSEFQGTGIGLATVQRIIHRHGGRVWAYAQVDQGATFYFTVKENI